MTRESVDASIRFDHVTFSRGAERLFSELSVSLSERRIGLVGDNGAGKSTFLRLTNGLMAPQSGRVLVDGINTKVDSSAAMRKVGFVFQNPDHQIVFPTVLEEVAFGFRARGASPASSREQARQALDLHHCAHWETASVDELSEGQRQRLCIISVVALQPDILVMDEPFASLDLPTRLSLMDMLNTLPQRMLIASHDLDLLAGLDRVIWLHKGSIRADGPPVDILRQYKKAAMEQRLLEASAS
jgi:biotin transport system ATP-binding protein